jgi:hypothetical protein
MLDLVTLVGHGAHVDEPHEPRALEKYQSAVGRELPVCFGTRNATKRTIWAGKTSAVTNPKRTFLECERIGGARRQADVSAPEHD